MKTAAAYIRVSTEDQLEFSPDSQLKRIEEYARTHDMCLPDEYIYLDEGFSGRKAQNRPAFLRMITEAKRKPRPFDVILLWKFSRFARNRQDSILYKSMLRRECGIDVLSITEQLSGDPTSILIEALLEAMDEYYSINLAEEVRRGMNEKFSRGGVVSIPPFGYRMESGHFSPDPTRAPFVSMIYEDFLRGSSCRAIARKLNERNILTTRGKPFEARAVRYILGNPVYTGKMRRSVQGEMMLVPGCHEPLISESLFQSVQKKLEGSDSTHMPKPAPSAFLFQGLVRCGCCGGALTRSSRTGALQCCRYAKGTCLQSHYLSIQELETVTLHTMKRDLADTGEAFALLYASAPEIRQKNELLRSLIEKIVFRSSDKNICICYRTFFRAR
ncbi:MAG: recombinase family protein [Lachnospiraceae bacterium]|nr:recombinase family protein [Lachnospiraceae bacterium]